MVNKSFLIENRTASQVVFTELGGSLNMMDGKTIAAVNTVLTTTKLHPFVLSLMQCT